MKKKNDLFGILLAAVVGTALLVSILVKIFLPRMILPQLDGANLVLLTLIALTAGHYLAPGARRDYRLVPLYAALIYGLLPLAACFVTPMEAVKLGLTGCVVATVVTWLFDAMVDRISSGPAEKLAPLVSAAGLYLAAQCLLGIL